MKTKYHKFVFALTGFSFLVLTILTCAVPAEEKVLRPARSAMDVEGYHVDIAPDKKQNPNDDSVNFFVKVTDSQKMKIKPEKIFLVSPDGKKHEPKQRKDHEESGPKEKPSSGFPSVGTSVGGMGIGLNLGDLFGWGGGSYAHTLVEFDKQDFMSDATLGIVLPSKKELRVSIASMAK